VDVGASLVSNAQAPVLVKPGECVLDHPTRSTKTRAMWVAGVGCANSIGDERVLFPVWQVDASSFVKRLPCLWSHLNLVVVAVKGMTGARSGAARSRARWGR
jgi:hypothetical protein